MTVVETKEDFNKEMEYRVLAERQRLINEVINEIPDYENCLQAGSDHLYEEVDLRAVKSELRNKYLTKQE